MKIPCPATGNRSFERVLGAIELEEIVGRAQITKFVAPRFPTSKSVDPLGADISPGKLQQLDFREIRTLFAHPEFVVRTIASNEVFDHDVARVYQFQNYTGASPFVYGIVVTDSNRNLVDFCLDASRQQQRRSVLTPIIRALCTAESVQRRIH